MTDPAASSSCGTGNDNGAGTNKDGRGGQLKKRSNRMIWNNERDLMLIGEVILARPFMYKQGTRERGRAWQEVADGMVSRQFQLDKRAVRDRMAYLCQRIKLNNNKEERATGISVEESDEEKKIRECVEEFIQQEEDIENQSTSNEAASDARKKLDGAEMRKRACETYGETMKRHEESNITPRRNRGADVIAIIEKKMEMESERRKEEAERRKEEEDRRKQEAEERKNYERAKEERWQQQNLQLQQQLLQQNQQTQTILLSLMQALKKD